MKYSYSNPGCQGFSFSDGTTSGQLQTEVWNFVNWAHAGNKGAKYSLEWDDEYTYGTPFVGGYFIIEVNGFGTNFEGAPAKHDCFR